MLPRAKPSVTADWREKSIVTLNDHEYQWRGQSLGLRYNRQHQIGEHRLYCCNMHTQRSFPSESMEPTEVCKRWNRREAFSILEDLGICNSTGNVTEKCYFVSDEKKRWTEAQKYCGRKGGNLAITKSKAEHVSYWQIACPPNREVLIFFWEKYRNGKIETWESESTTEMKFPPRVLINDP